MRNTQNRPQWIKLWAEKYYDDLCIDDIKEFYPTEEEEQEFLLEVGKAFVSALSFYNAYNNPEKESYTTYAMGKDGKRLYKSFQRDIEQSYSAYERRVENGKTGGRPHRIYEKEV